MAMNKKVVKLVLICFVFIQPLWAYADRCSDVKSEAHRIFQRAQSASKEKQFSEAIEFYKEAKELFTEVVAMSDCSNPDLKHCARNNIDMCSKNISNNKKALKTSEDDIEVYVIYNEARDKFNEGRSYARNRQWDDALLAFEEAEDIWNSIASTDSVIGNKAMKSAERARHHAARVLLRLEQE